MARRERKATEHGPARSGLTRVRKLLARSWSRYRTDWRLLTGTAAVVAAPLSLASLSNELIDDRAFNAYAGIATLIAALALASAVIRPASGRGRIRAAYYDGTAALVRLVIALVVTIAWVFAGLTILVAAALKQGLGWLSARLLRATTAAKVLRLIILIVAWTLATVLILTAAAVNVLAWVVVNYANVFIYTLGLPIIVAAAVLTLVPAVMVLVRHCYALPLLIETDARPLALLARSRTLVRRRFWATTARLAALAGIMLVALLATLAVALPLELIVRYENIPQAFFQVVLGIVVAPFAVIYLHELYSGARANVRTS